MSKTAEINLWGIHGGKTGDADTLFLKKNCVAVGWTRMGDLAALKPDRDAFKTRVLEVYPEKKPGAIPNNAGQLFRFVHEMRLGDIVVYPSKRDRQIHLGWAGKKMYRESFLIPFPSTDPHEVGTECHLPFTSAPSSGTTARFSVMRQWANVCYSPRQQY